MLFFHGDNTGSNPVGDANNFFSVVIDSKILTSKQTARKWGSVRTSDSFISDCLATLRSGTNIFASLNRICMVLTCSSHLNRCLQFADVFTSCLTAFVAGEDRWSPPVANSLRALLRTEMNRVGGCGVKIHPDYID